MERGRAGELWRRGEGGGGRRGTRERREGSIAVMALRSVSLEDSNILEVSQILVTL
jgi:hypothetical protein